MGLSIPHRHPTSLGKLDGEHRHYKRKCNTKKRSEGTWSSPRVREACSQLSAGPEEGLAKGVAGQRECGAVE